MEKDDDLKSDKTSAGKKAFNQQQNSAAPLKGNDNDSTEVGMVSDEELETEKKIHEAQTERD